MAKKSRTDPNETHFLILRKLAHGKSLERTAFEAPKLEKLYHMRQKETPQTKISDQYIPHSTLITRLEELVDSHFILEINSGKKSKKQLPIMEYRLTLYGFIRLLQLCKEKEFYSDLFQNSEHYLPSVIVNQIRLLIKSKIFGIKQLFLLLVDVAKKIDIQIDFEPRRDSGSTITRPFLLSGKENSSKTKYVHVFSVFMKIRQIHSDYNVERTFVSSGKTEQEIKLQDGEHILRINRMFIFAFVNELIMRCYRINDRHKEYPRPDEAVFLLEILRLDNTIKQIYFEQIDEILYQQEIERDTILDVQKSLRSTKSLISRKKQK